MGKEPASKPLDNKSNLFFIVLYVFLVAAYLVIRYKGKWLEGDTVRQIESTINLLQNGSLASTEKSYLFGYNYQFISSLLSLLTGVDVHNLLTLIRPFWIIILPPVGYLYYRQLFIEEYSATLATFLLFLQPELMFVTLRGSHEVITWLLVLLAVFILTQSYLKSRYSRLFHTYALMFYLVVYALISTNFFFASTFIFGLVIAFIIGTSLSKYLPLKANQATYRIYSRLLMSTMAGFVLIFIFIFYVYAPAQLPFNQLRTLIEKISATLFSFEVNTNPYGQFISTTWISPWIYLALTLGNWVTMLVSSVGCVLIGYRRIILREGISQPMYLLWLLYLAFTLQLFLSIIVDFSGVLSSNLQLRLFPALIITAVPIATFLIHEIAKKYNIHHPSVKILFSSISLIMIGWLVAASLLKSTNEPWVSNKWNFSTESEDAGIRWMNQYIKFGPVWISPDERLRDISIAANPNPRNFMAYDIFTVSAGTKYVFLSDVNKMLAQRLKLILPDLDQENIIYSNGNTDIYKFRTETLFEK